MRYRIGIENHVEGRSLAWALDYPGCFAYGADETDALMAAALAIPAYLHWLEKHHEPLSPDSVAVDIRLVEVWDGYDINNAYERVEKGTHIDAWFQNDWKPLTAEEVDRTLQMLKWTREELLAVTELAPTTLRDEVQVGERWSINGVLRHVAGAEWWYLDRMGEADLPREELPRETAERLLVTRNRVEKVLPQWIGIEKVLGRDGEWWSPRKVVRRLLWHERDHTGHILRLATDS